MSKKKKNTIMESCHGDITTVREWKVPEDEQIEITVKTKKKKKLSEISSVEYPPRVLREFLFYDTF